MNTTMSDSPTTNVSALEGVKVLELCSFVAGPFSTKLLADMGADVIKVEPPGTGDESRNRRPFYQGGPGADSSLLFNYLNINKWGITLNSSTLKGKEVLLELLKTVDLLVEDLPSSDVAGLGLDYASLQQTNPHLVCTSITPFGRSGPYKDHKAYYLNSYHAGGDGWMLPGGRLADQLYPEREPIKAGGYLGEYQVGLSAGIASMAALLGRMTNGRGRHIDVSKQETLINLNAADLCQYPNRGYMEDRRHRHLYLYIGGLYRCKDGYWELLVQSQRHWDGLMKVMGEPEWAKADEYGTHDSRVARRFEIDEKIEVWALEHTRDEIYHSLQREGCAAGPVYSTEEMLQDEQMAYRGFFADMEHPKLGKFKTPSSAYSFSSTPWSVRRPAPGLGEHNAEIYGGWLGYDRGELTRLGRQGII